MLKLAQGISVKVYYLFIYTNLFLVSGKKMIRTLVSRDNFKYGTPEPILIICHKKSKNMDAILRVVKY